LKKVGGKKPRSSKKQGSYGLGGRREATKYGEMGRKKHFNGAHDREGKARDEPAPREETVKKKPCDTIGSA